MLTLRVACLSIGLALVPVACRSTGGTLTTPAEMAQAERAQVASGAASGASNAADAAAAAARAGAVGAAQAASRDRALSPERQVQRDGFDGRGIALTRRREDRTRNAAELEQRRARVQLEHASAQAGEGIALRTAEREQRLAAEDVTHFADVELPRRLAESALELRGAADGLLETREELAQLEMMYSESDLGDATAEIVLARTRRRLQRAEDGYKLRMQRAEDLKLITLPRDGERLALELQAKTVALETARRAAEQGRLTREAAQRDLLFEERKLAREAEDIARDELLLTAEIERWERQMSAENAEGGKS